MKTETIQVTVEGTVQASLSLYIQEDYPDTYGERKRPLVLICPGGGYEHVSVREGEPVALHFLTAGCHAAVLWYDISKHGVAYPQELKELAWSVAYLRAHADQYAIYKDKILVAGFSAGVLCPNHLSVLQNLRSYLRRASCGESGLLLGQRLAGTGIADDKGMLSAKRSDSRISCDYLGRICAQRQLCEPDGR